MVLHDFLKTLLQSLALPVEFKKVSTSAGNNYSSGFASIFFKDGTKSTVTILDLEINTIVRKGEYLEADVFQAVNPTDHLIPYQATPSSYVLALSLAAHIAVVYTIGLPVLNFFKKKG